MIPNAARKERTNLSAAAGTAYSVEVYDVSTNRTFILTDLIYSTSDTGEGVILYDGASAATPTAGTEKMKLNGNPWILTDIQNGPEFSIGVTAAIIGNRALPTYSVWCGGFER